MGRLSNVAAKGEVIDGDREAVGRQSVTRCSLVSRLAYSCSSTSTWWMFVECWSVWGVRCEVCYRGQKRCLTPLRYVHKIVGIGTHPKNASRILWRRDNKPCKVFLRTRSTIPTVATPTKFGREHDFFTVTSENASCSLNIVRHFFCNSRFLTPVARRIVSYTATVQIPPHRSSDQAETLDLRPY